MRILNSQDAVTAEYKGPAGAVHAQDFITNDDLVAGLRRVPAGSRAPGHVAAESPHQHLLYVVSGSATVTNGEYYEKIQPGHVVLFEPGDRPYYQTGEDELVVFELSWKRGATPSVAAPERSPIDDTPVTRTEATGSVYMEV